MLRLILWNPLLFVWLAWCTQALLVLIQVGKFERRVARRRLPGPSAYQPSAVIIVPFKGYDHDLGANIRALLAQDYAHYQLIAVVEHEDDPATAKLRDAFAQCAAGAQAQILIAGVAPADSGQKVHNQLAALEYLDKLHNNLGNNSPNDKNDKAPEILVFADSDAVPHNRWLAHLINPLAPVPPPQPNTPANDPGTPVGATTGYRWLIPQLRAQRPGWGSVFASVINSSVATFLGYGKYTQAWGGSMAMHASFARKHNLRGYLRGGLSDDYQVTRLCRDAGHRVYFVHHCLVPSTIDLNLRGLLEFGRRQYLITRIHDPALYYKAVGLMSFYLFALISAWVGGFVAWQMGYPDVTLCALCALCAVGLLNQYRAILRRRAIQSAFGPTMLHHMRRTLWVDRFATPVVMAVNLILLLSAHNNRRLIWRGITYDLQGPQQVTAHREERRTPTPRRGDDAATDPSRRGE